MSAHKYELMFIADPELDERGLKKLTEQYLDVVVKYTAEPATSDELDRVLNLNESVIRTKILRKG